MKHIKLVLLFCLLLCNLCSTGQYKSDYTPVKYSSSGNKMNESTFNKKLSVKYNTVDQAMIKKFNKYLYVLHRGSAAGAKSKQYIEEPFMKKYLKNILDSVTIHNGLKEKFEIVCTRYAAPNAFNMGDYKLYINIGLLEQLTNESQVAFLICHELSHQLLFHVQDHFITEEKRSKDKAVKKEIRDINKAKYNKLDKTFQFLKNYNYDFATYSRANEESADSMALVLLRKTDYDLREGISLMQILDHADDDSSKIDYTKYLENNAHSLKPEWLIAKKNTMSFGNKKAMEFDKDSIKTHPDIPYRIKMIDSQIALLKFEPTGKHIFMQSNALFDSVVHTSKFEIIETYLFRKRYAAVVYYAILLLNEFPENNYLYKNIAIGLSEINKAIKKHTIQNFIPIESDDFSEGYNQLLRIIDRTTVDEFDMLCQHYVTRYYARISSYPEIQTIYNGFTKK